MFGEKPIYGQSKVRVDPKGRVIIPQFTNVTPDDELLILRDNKGIRVINIEDVDEYIEYLEKLCSEEFDPDKHQAIKERLYYIYENILKKVSCDKAHRLLLSGALEAGKDYLVVGCRKSILIRKLQEDDKNPESENTQKQLKPNT